jgi:epoxide hydrolase
MEPCLLNRRTLLRGAVAASALIRLRPVRADASDDDQLEPFTFHVSEAALSDLRRRLTDVRWPESATEPGWQQGPPIEAIQALVAHWREDYDWRRTEAPLNRWPQFLTRIDGARHSLPACSLAASGCGAAGVDPRLAEFRAPVPERDRASCQSDGS